MELEIRAKIQDLDTFYNSVEALEGIEVKLKGVRQVDTYMKHKADEDRILVIRIRRKDDKAILTFKTKSIGQTDTLWQDIDIPFDEPDRLEDILMNSGYVYVALVDKVRDSFQYGEIEINIDNVRELGPYVEVEAIVEDEKQSESKKKELFALLKKLGVPKKDVVEKGYVPLMIEHEQSSL